MKNCLSQLLSTSLPLSFPPRDVTVSLLSSPPLPQWRRHGSQTSYMMAEDSQDEYPKRNWQNFHVCFHLSGKSHSITSATLRVCPSLRGGDIYATFLWECGCFRSITKTLLPKAVCACTPFLFLIFPSILLPGIWLLLSWATRLRSGPAEQHDGGGLPHCEPSHSS